MKKITFVRVPEGQVEEYFGEFFRTSCFTFEGLDITDKKSNKDLEKAIRNAGYKEDEILCYTYTGKMMNDFYNLVGDNRYKDDLTFVSIPNLHYPMFKLLMNARWFDDIVQNNAYRNAELLKEKEDA